MEKPRIYPGLRVTVPNDPGLPFFTAQLGETFTVLGHQRDPGVWIVYFDNPVGWSDGCHMWWIGEATLRSLAALGKGER